MALAGGYGAELDLKKVPCEAITREDFLLFSESNSRFMMEVAEEDKAAFESLFTGSDCAEIGRVTKNHMLVVKGLKGSKVVDASVSDLRASWKRTLSSEV
jgi:phosphoribosylformylglycinamidine synthase